MNKTYDSYASLLGVRSLKMGDKVFFKNANISFSVGVGGEHFVYQGTESNSNLIKLLTRLGFKKTKSFAETFCDILGVPKRTRTLV